MSQTLYERWRGQSDQLGQGWAEPTQVVKVRKGRFYRRYDDWDEGAVPIGAHIVGGNNHKPWQAFWTPETAYAEIPGVLQFDEQQGFDNNGITVATIQIENQAWVEQNTLGAIFHTIERGYLSPLKGYRAPGRPKTGAVENAWYGLLAENAQITVWQGYGDEQPKTFTGLVDSVEPASRPDRLTVTLRDFGQVLTDQEFFGWNHDPLIRDPVTFAPREWKTAHEGYHAAAGTEGSHHPPELVADQEGSTYWCSRSYNTTHATDYVEVHLPQGNYTRFFLWPKWVEQSAYVSIYMRARDDGHHCRFDGQIVADNSWVDIGLGNVPGALGGVPYVRYMSHLDDRGRYFRFGEGGPSMQVGNGTVLRISLRDLTPRTPDDMPPGEPADIGYRAGVVRLFATRRLGIEWDSETLREAQDAHWILVDDVADAVKVILRWAGFKEWDVESTGVPLKKPLMLNRADKYADAINKLAESTNYVFFMAPPSSADLSIGVPTFRQARVVTRDQPIAQVRDRDLLTGIRVRFDDEPLAYSIRFRGREVHSFGPGIGYLIGGGDVRRVKFTYYPPWARENNELAGILKHVWQNDETLRTTEDCMFACYYVALHQALQSCTGTIQVPAYPGFTLDSFASVVDEGTGMNTRLWIASRSSTFLAGEAKSWKQSLSGTFVDTPRVKTVVDEINAAVRSGE